jgi:hypothetical protein
MYMSYVMKVNDVSRFEPLMLYLSICWNIANNKMSQNYFTKLYNM